MRGNGYILSIVARSLKKGRLRESVAIFGSWLRSRLVESDQLVYFSDMALSPPLSHDGSVTISVSDLDEASGWSALFRCGFDLKAAARNGCDFWKIERDGVQIGFMVTKRPTAIPTYFFRLPDDCVYLAYSYIAEEHRGRGAYCKARAALPAALRPHGVRWVISNCDVWNIPIRRVMDRSGAVLIGRGWKRHNGARRFVHFQAQPWRTSDPTTPSFR